MEQNIGKQYEANEESNALPTEHRNRLQLVLVRSTLGENPDHDAVARWVDTYSKRVAEIIDDPANEELRNLIIQQRYDEAARIIDNKFADDTQIEKAA